VAIEDRRSSSVHSVSLKPLGETWQHNVYRDDRHIDIGGFVERDRTEAACEVVLIKLLLAPDNGSPQDRTST
jgi:hypothetical protein